MFGSHFIEIRFYNFLLFKYLPGKSNPYEFYKKGFHSKKITACEAMGVQGIIGPFPFEIAQATATINSDRCAAVLGRFWRSGRDVQPSLLLKQVAQAR